MKSKQFQLHSALLVMTALAAISITWFVFRSNRSYVTNLPDGSRLELAAVTSGNQLKFFKGKSWQQPLFHLFGTNLSRKFVGYGSILPSAFKSDSLFLQFSHHIDTTAEKRAMQRRVRVKVEAEDRSINARFLDYWELTHSNHVTIASAWEVKRLKGQKIRVVFQYHKNTNTVEFIVPNPSPLNE